MKEIIKIAFFGPSGSGKTLAGDLAMQIGEKIGLHTARIDVAKPLHDIQAFAYTQFNLPNTGQDQALLRFLAGKFESQLSISFTTRLDKIMSTTPKPTLIINSDVRNNTYECLKSLGFIFIRVLSAPRNRPRDVTPPDFTARVEQSNKIMPDYFLENYSNQITLVQKITTLLTNLVN